MLDYQSDNQAFWRFIALHIFFQKKMKQYRKFFDQTVTNSLATLIFFLIVEIITFNAEL
jgi:phosphotransferase system  glucose/maltose/N-acetylglucosamine-specific IIC component